MAILDVFKKKTEEKKPEVRKVKKQAPKKSAVSVKPVVATTPKSKRDSDTAYRILRGPHITEKADSLTAFGQYVFNVYTAAGKSEIKKSVEEVYGVDVVAVKIINIHPKKRRLGKVQGWKQGYKKAIVKLAAGQKIELLPR
jgi:large subunit ribosomal protein L23